MRRTQYFETGDPRSLPGGESAGQHTARITGPREAEHLSLSGPGTLENRGEGQNMIEYGRRKERKKPPPARRETCISDLERATRFPSTSSSSSSRYNRLHIVVLVPPFLSAGVPPSPSLSLSRSLERPGRLSVRAARARCPFSARGSMPDYATQVHS